MMMPIRKTMISEQDFVSGCRMRWRKRKLQRYSRHIISYPKHIVELPEKQCRRENIGLVFAGHLIFISDCLAFRAFQRQNRNGCKSKKHSLLLQRMVFFSRIAIRRFLKFATNCSKAIRKPFGCGGWLRKLHGWHNVGSIMFHGFCSGMTH